MSAPKTRPDKKGFYIGLEHTEVRTLLNIANFLYEVQDVSQPNDKLGPKVRRRILGYMANAYLGDPDYRLVSHGLEYRAQDQIQKAHEGRQLKLEKIGTQIQGRISDCCGMERERGIRQIKRRQK